MLPLAVRRLAVLAAVVASLAAPGCGREPGKAPSDGPADSTVTTRRRIVALEAARNLGAGELYAHLRHPDARVRRAAVVALGRIQDATTIDSLLPLLDDPDSSVVVQTAFALGQMQGVDEDRRYRLQAPLVARVDQHPQPDVVPFVEALGRQGGPEVAPVLEQCLASGAFSGMGSEARDPLLEGMAALGVAHIGTDPCRDYLANLGPLTNRGVEAAFRIGAAFAVLPDTAYFGSAVTLLDHAHPDARAQGARALGKLGDPRAFHPLVQHLPDLDWEVRASILLAMAELADPRHPNAEAVDFCAALAADAHPLVREAAVAALDSFAVAERRPTLREGLADAVPAVRLAALRALARVDHGAMQQEFEAARRDTVEFVRAEVLAAARDVFGDAGAVPILVQALETGGIRERTAAAAALGDLNLGSERGRQARAALETALRDSDFVVAATAAAALGTLGPQPSIAALARAYETRQARREDVDVRLAVIEALGSAPATRRAPDVPRARALCERARKDADARVARAAEVALAHLDGRPPAPPAAPRALDTPLVADSVPPVDLGLVTVRLVTAAGTALLELDGDRFPRTVANFLRLVDSGFYDHGVFHRVVPAFVVQGGCPRGDGWGDAGFTIPCEYGDLRYDAAGVVGMAHAGKDTGGSQFFITHVPVPRLDGRYTAFGRVREGMDVVDRIVRGDAFRIERVEPVARR